VDEGHEIAAVFAIVHRSRRWRWPQSKKGDVQMKSVTRSLAIFRVAALALCSPLLVIPHAHAQTDPLPSWNDGPAKQAIVAFVRATTDQSSPQFAPPEARVATFDQDGALWVEHPMYTQVVYCLERVKALAEKKPELKNVEPFKTVLSGDREAIAKLTMPDLEKILVATLSGMTVERFSAEVKNWLATARRPRWNRPYTELVYQPTRNKWNELGDSQCQLMFSKS
jgi:hypothetical protein